MFGALAPWISLQGMVQLHAQENGLPGNRISPKAKFFGAVVVVGPLHTL
jgi:hypothetical protein